jgi:hypothetical protein
MGAATLQTTKNDTTTLLPQHAALLQASKIAPGVQAARGYRSIVTKAVVVRLGFSDRQANVPALLIPQWNVAGEVAGYQLRPDQPRVGQGGRPIKYETPKRARLVIDVPPPARKQIGDPKVSLWITEGSRKADAAVSQGLCCISVPGVYGWRGTNDDGGTVALPDWEQIALNDRTVYLAFDSDVLTKRSVLRALSRFLRFLESRRAQVHIVSIPAGPGGAKVGLDDYFAAGGDLLSLVNTASDDLPAPEPDPAEEPTAGPYGVRGGRICVHKPGEAGGQWIPLCEFDARIAEEVQTGDGQSTAAEYVIIGTLAGGRDFPPIRVAAKRFPSLDWALEWGADAIVGAGFGTKDKLREAIQRLSAGKTKRRHEYTHTGWRYFDEYGWAYLHAGGAVTAGGLVQGLCVSLTDRAMFLRLPAPPEGEALRTAVRLALEMLDCAPDRITAPLLGAVWRAPLNEMQPADLVPGLFGQSGVMKSELAALAMRWYGPDFDRLHLPAAWAATPNHLERVAFDFKDALLVIDDFAPSGSSHDIARYHAAAERVIRGAGNAAGRGRMGADLTLRPSFKPRALVVLTGEDTPRGQSVQARMVSLDVEAGDVDAERLSVYQASPSKDAPSQAMAGFLVWLAARFDEVRAELPATLARLRTALVGQGRHPRMPDALANLLAGWWVFLRFAVDVSALSPAEARAYAARAAAAFLQVADDQASLAAAVNPATRYLEWLAAALTMGDLHFAGPDGQVPNEAGSWGWTERPGGTGPYEEPIWTPRGKCVGWVTGDDLYLEPHAAFVMVQRLAQASGEPLPVSPKTLTKRLHEAGLLASTEGKRGTLVIRKVIAGERRAVLHLAASTLRATTPAQPAQSAQTAGSPDGSATDAEALGKILWADAPEDTPESAQENSPPAASVALDAEGGGQDGQIGQAASPGNGRSPERGETLTAAQVNGHRADAAHEAAQSPLLEMPPAERTVGECAHCGAVTDGALLCWGCR